MIRFLMKFYPGLTSVGRTTFTLHAAICFTRRSWNEQRASYLKLACEFAVCFVLFICYRKLYHAIPQWIHRCSNTTRKTGLTDIWQNFGKIWVVVGCIGNDVRRSNAFCSMIWNLQNCLTEFSKFNRIHPFRCDGCWHFNRTADFATDFSPSYLSFKVGTPKQKSLENQPENPNQKM